MKRLSAIGGVILVLFFAFQAWAGRPLPDTGQTLCYDVDGEEITCTGTGQDGAYTINPMSFTKLDASGNDLPIDASEWVMVRDNVTGLIWEVKQNMDEEQDYGNPHDADNRYTWYDPNSETNGGNAGSQSENDTLDFTTALNNANFGGYNDWRMPSRNELQSIVDYSVVMPGLPIDAVYFPNTVISVSYYWSSSTDAEQSPEVAWGVNFEDGYGFCGTSLKINPWYVRAVRGGQPWALRPLVINDADTVTDGRTGLMWQRTTYGPTSWTNALAYCEGATTGGYTDWRLPTSRELSSIVDLNKDDAPVIDEAAFPNTAVSYYYWSSSTYASYTFDAWTVGFDRGYDAYQYKPINRYVRAVRGGQHLIDGNLFVITPHQASSWNIGTTMPINWDTAEISESEQVIISLSRSGGATGTFEQLAITANDGYYEWPVSGASTVNGYLRIEPVSAALKSKATAVSLFSIGDYILIDEQTPGDMTISEASPSNVATFKIKLTQAPTEDVTIGITSGDTDICTVSPSAVTLTTSNYSAGVLVTVTSVDNGFYDGDRPCSIQTEPMESLDIFFDGMLVPDVSVTVQDDGDPPLYTVDFQAGTGGTVTGTTPQTVNSGNDCTSVTAVPGADFLFVNWTGTGGFATTAANPLTVTGVTADMTVTANFQAKTRIIGLSGNLNFGNVAAGSVRQSTLNISNTGNSAMTVGSINYPSGFNGDWSGGTIAAGGSRDVTVSFAPTAGQSYGGTVTVNADHTAGTNTIAASGTGVQQCTVTFQAGTGGAVTGATPQTVNSGGNCTSVTAVPDTNYVFINWTGTGGFTATSANPLTVTGVTADMTVTANFQNLASIVNLPSPVPDTGQTKCHNENGALVPCAGTGYDGAFAINTPSYTKLNERGGALPADATEWAMVRDNVTGLIWEAKTDDGTIHDRDNIYTWYDDDPATNGGNAGAFGSGLNTAAFIDGLNAAHFGGIDTWRMPTREELRTIVDYGVKLPGPCVDAAYFSDGVASVYWTADTFAADAANAWYLNFSEGYDGYDGKAQQRYARAVSGGTVHSPDHWIVNGDGTVTDTKTGLMWELKTDDGSVSDRDATYTWKAAHNTFIVQLNQLSPDYDDWRMPTIKELASLSDLTASNPAVGALIFPNTVSADYWSSTTDAGVTGDAWGVSFFHGNDNGYGKTDEKYVRAVRGGQVKIDGNLFIAVPGPASAWDIGSIMPISWDTAGIGGDIRIWYSRDGGKPGTYEQIDTSGDPENDGYFEWLVTGPSTANGFLKIEPVANPEKAATMGMIVMDNFILVEPRELTIGEDSGSRTDTFTIRLEKAPAADVKIQLRSSNTGQCMVSPSTVVLEKGSGAVAGVTVTVTAIDDGVNDGSWTGSILTQPAESLDRTYDGMAVADVRVTVTDDDAPSVLTIDSVQPNLVEVGQTITLAVTGEGLNAGVVSGAILLLQNEDGSPDWTHRLEQTDFIAMGTELVADFPAASVVGQYTLRVLHSTGFEEVLGAITVADSSALVDMQGKKAVIVAGRENATDALWVSSMNNANRAYKALRRQGFSGENIRYLTHMADMDVDGDGEFDKDGDPTQAALQTAVTNWAADAEELILYMVDHGGEEFFHLDYGDYARADELKAWLDTLQQTRAMRVIVIVDACMSGGFLNGLSLTGGVHSQSERVVIASAGAEEPAWFQNDGDVSFSRYFWDSAHMTGRLFRSFIKGREHMTIQNPLADRDGDGGADEITLAGLFNDPASEILIGRGRIAASTPPVIGTVCSDQTIDCETSATISASDIMFFNGETSVVARIIPPAYDDAPSDEPVQELPAIRLTDIDQDDEYTGTYDDFTLTGVYRIVIYATDKKDVDSIPKMTRVIRTCGVSSKKGDINLDFETDLADAIIALKVLAGIEVAAGDIRPDYGADNADVDGDGQVGLAEAVYALQKAAGMR